MSSDTTNHPAVRAYLHELASKGGLAAAAAGTAHRWTSEEAARASNKRWRDYRQERAVRLGREAVQGAANLTAREQEVLALRERHTLAEVAKRMGVSRQRVGQIEREARGKV